jgi:hypothetical protein
MGLQNHLPATRRRFIHADKAGPATSDSYFRGKTDRLGATISANMQYKSPQQKYVP